MYKLPCSFFDLFQYHSSHTDNMFTALKSFRIPLIQLFKSKSVETRKSVSTIAVDTGHNYSIRSLATVALNLPATCLMWYLVIVRYLKTSGL